MSIVLHPLAPALAEVAATLHHQAMAPAWPVDAWRTALGAPGRYGWLAAEADVPAAVVLCAMAGDDVEILMLAVDPLRRRRQLGRLLLARAVAEAAARGAARVLLEVATENLAALGLYNGAGFTRIGSRRGYYTGPEGARDALVLARALLPGC